MFSYFKNLAHNSERLRYHHIGISFVPLNQTRYLTLGERGERATYGGDARVPLMHACSDSNLSAAKNLLLPQVRYLKIYVHKFLVKFSLTNYPHLISNLTTGIPRS